jgi:hypothetical protein
MGALFPNKHRTKGKSVLRCFAKEKNENDAICKQFANATRVFAQFLFVIFTN